MSLYVEYEFPHLKYHQDPILLTQEKHKVQQLVNEIRHKRYHWGNNDILFITW